MSSDSNLAAQLRFVIESRSTIIGILLSSEDSKIIRRNKPSDFFTRSFAGKRSLRATRALFRRLAVIGQDLVEPGHLAAEFLDVGGALVAQLAGADLLHRQQHLAQMGAAETGGAI